MKKLNLLADDGLLALKWTQATFDEVLQVLREFGGISGLHVNKHKSLVVPVGTSFKDKDLLMNMDQFQPAVTGGRFKYLGINWLVGKYSVYPEGNFDNILGTAQQILENRNQNHHTLLGRILTVKFLIMSRFVYQFKGTPSPPQKWLHKLQSLVNHYIWAGGVHHVNAARTYLSFKEGGFNMENVIAQDQALKLSWLDRALNGPPSFWSKQLQSCLKIPLREFLSSNISHFHIQRLCKESLPPMWFSILKCWCLLHFTKTGGNINVMPLMYNSALADRKHPYVFDAEYEKLLTDAGIYTVQDFIEMYDLLSITDAHNLHATYIMDAMPGEWITQVDSEDFGDQSQLDLMLLKGFTAKTSYNTILRLKPPPPLVIVDHWNESLNCTDIDWKRVCTIAQSLVSIKLRSFYFKYINRGFIFNARHSVWKSDCSKECNMCNIDPETYVHVFWECPLIQPLWVEFIKWCSEHYRFV